GDAGNIAVCPVGHLFLLAIGAVCPAFCTILVRRVRPDTPDLGGMQKISLPRRGGTIILRERLEMILRRLLAAAGTESGIDAALEARERLQALAVREWQKLHQDHAADVARRIDPEV